LKDNGLKAYVPSFKLMRKGLIKILIKDVDKDISEKEIMEFIEFKYEVLNIRRFNRRNKNLVTQDNDPKWIPRSVVITFLGQNLSNESFTK